MCIFNVFRYLVGAEAKFNFLGSVTVASVLGGGRSSKPYVTDEDMIATLQNSM
jgi:hypothetical protein